MISPRVRQAVEHAEKVSNAYGVNIIGKTIELLKEMYEDIDSDDEDSSTVVDLADAWLNAGDEIIRKAFLGAEGHMSSKKVVVMKATCSDLAEVLSEEFDTVEEIEKALGT